MRLKTIIIGVLINLIFSIGYTAYADSFNNDDYIVYLKSPKNRVRAVQQSETSKKYITATGDELRSLLANDMVAFYEPNLKIKLFEDFSGNQTANQWNHENIKLAKAWQIGCYGNDIKVGVIDSGVYNHPDLEANLLEGHNYLTDSNDTSDYFGHGTFVAGIIAAESNNEYIDGIAYHAKIVPLKCFDENNDSSAAIIADAIYDAVDIYGCDVINMSFGMSEFHTNITLETAVAYALQNGCILVAAVGNDGKNTVYYPAAYDGVVGVGAVDKRNKLCYFSQKNSTVDVVAPGKNISSVSIPGFNSVSGTSFSAPHVSAMAAIAKCIDKDITPTEFQSLLQTTSTRLGGDEYNTSYGYGIINIQAMVDELLKNTGVFVSPAERTNSGANVKVYNNSDEPLSAKGIAAGYTGVRFSGISITNLLLQPGETACLSSSADSAKFMLWRDFTGMRPLAAYR